MITGCVSVCVPAEWHPLSSNQDSCHLMLLYSLVELGLRPAVFWSHLAWCRCTCLGLKNQRKAEKQMDIFWKMKKRRNMRMFDFPIIPQVFQLFETLGGWGWGQIVPKAYQRESIYTKHCIGEVCLMGGGACICDGRFFCCCWGGEKCSSLRLGDRP